MPSPGPEVLALAERFRLGLAFDPGKGPAGPRLARALGASLEFQDRRAYAAGDDLRHVDWRALLRTDQLLVRQHREEVLPRLELLVDDSRSMALTPAKAQGTVELAALLACAARGDGFEVRLFRLGEQVERLDLQRFLESGLELADAARLQAGVAELGARLVPGSLRLLLSDFLTPHSAAPLVRGLAQRAARLCLVQLLAPEDARPDAAGEALRLVDAESGATLDLARDEPAVARYLERLERLSTELERECVRAGGLFRSLVLDRPVAELARSELAQAGLLVPA
jgi:uncharacterized protein (DUF58 family)